MRVSKKFLAALSLAAMLLTLCIAAESQAVLSAVGAPDPVNGFPTSYTDANGLSLTLCTDPVNCIVTPPIVGNVFSQTIGFGAEMFYFIADSDLITVGPQVLGGPTDTTSLRLALEAAFGGVTGDPVAGEQITFARFNLRRIVSGNLCSAVALQNCVLAPNSIYTVTHPMGVFNFNTDANGNAILSLGGQAFRVQDGCAAPPFPCDFAAVLPTPTTNFGPFLTALAPAPPAGFIGNPFALQTLTGGINNNAVTITGPNIGGPGVGSVSTNLWNLAGQRAGRFQDVPVSHLFFSQIEAIAAAGITGGCSANPPLFCPDNPVTRAQMAVFIETSLGAVPPICTGTLFADVSPLTVGQAFCNFIEDFAARGITGGCGGGNFCPNDPVTREQMAVFIEAALGVPQPPCNGLRFGDVNVVATGAAFCGFIEDFALRGITGGCQAGPPPLFCPLDPVTRGQMAVFLVAAPPPLLP